MARAHADRIAALERRSQRTATTSSTNPCTGTRDATPPAPTKLPGALSITPCAQPLSERRDRAINSKTPGATITSTLTLTSPGTPGAAGLPLNTLKRADSSATDAAADGGGKENGVAKGDLAALGMTAVHLAMHAEGLDILREAECWHELIEVLQVRCS